MNSRQIFKAEAKYTRDEVFAASLEYFDGDRLAADVFTNKYALRDPHNSDTPYAELTPDDMHNRLSFELARVDCGYVFGASKVNDFLRSTTWTFDISKYEILFPFFAPELEEIVVAFQKEFTKWREAMHRFRKLCPQGSPMTAMGNPFVLMSLSNCTVVAPPKDNVSSIMDTGKHMANLYKARAGVGVDISTLRPFLAPVNNAAINSTGAYSFSNHYSNVTRLIGQGGRRGALMLTIDIKHPDSDRFTTMKLDLSFCTGANISVRVTDDFMKAVDNDTNFDMVWPTDTNVKEYLAQTEGIWVKRPEERHTYPNYQGTAVESVTAVASEVYVPSKRQEKGGVVVRRVKARDLWDLICDTARRTAEPGLLFWDNYTKNLPAHFYPGFESTSTNPCSEILLSNFDSCRLLTMNITGFVKNPFTSKAKFDYDSFDYYVRLGQRAMDNIVDLEIEALTYIRENCDDESEKWLWGKMIDAAHKGRRTGLGAHALGDSLAQLTIRYDTKEGVDTTFKIYNKFMISAYDESCNLAVERGAFPDWNTEYDNKSDFIHRLPSDLLKKMRSTGRRNISILTLAPTGSVSICCQTSSGLEPVFSNYYMRRRKVNPSDLNTRVDFVDQQGDSWQEYPVFHHNVEKYLKSQNKWAEVEEILANTPKGEVNVALDKLLPEYFVVAENIDPDQRVDLQAAITINLDHGSSSTINLPKDTTTETIQNIYHRAWKAGLKGVTVYVDGSRSGVLVNVNSVEDDSSIKDAYVPKRPEVLECDIHRSQIDGEKWLILVGKINGRPYEVFGGLSECVTIPKRITEGKLLKRKCKQLNAKGRLSCYDLVIGEGEDAWVIADIVSSFKDSEHAHETRSISMLLRSGNQVHHITDMLGRDPGRPMFSFSKVMSRVLNKYVEDGVASGEKCSECGSKMVFQDACLYCLSCGHSPKCN